MRKGVSNQNKEVIYHYSKELSQLLGVYDGQQPGSDKKGDFLEGVRPYDLNGGIHSLYVYSDVVEFSTVGDVRAQLLRAVKIPNLIQFGDNVDITYERPYYIPVASKEVRSIEIDIKDDAGEPVEFMFGRVQVVLHFVKVQ